jgi:hypothetical protein
MLRSRKFTHRGRALEVRTIKTENRYTAAVYEQERPTAPMEYAVSVIGEDESAEADIATYLSLTTENDFKRWSDFRWARDGTPSAATRPRRAM